MALVKEGYLHYMDIKKFFKILKKKMAVVLSEIQVSDPGHFGPLVS